MLNRAGEDVQIPVGMKILNILSGDGVCTEFQWLICVNLMGKVHTDKLRFDFW